MDFLNQVGAKLGSAFMGFIGSPDWLPLAFLFGAVLLGTLAVGAVFRSSGSVRTRMAGTGSGSYERAHKISLRQHEPNTRLHQVLKGLEKHVIATNDKERSSIRLRMIQAGFMGDTAVRLYYLIRVLLAVTLPVAFLLMSPDLVPQMAFKKVIGIAGGLAVLGLYLPYRWVQAKIESRQRAVTEGFPDALDMLVVCVEAGLGMDAAFVRVGQQLATAHPVLSAQLGLVALELRAGKSREEALRNFATRSGVQDVSNFVTLLIQSEALGADLSQTLRVQADEMRAKRMLRAEETAHKLPVKLSMILVSFILPAMFAVVLGPGIINIARNVLPHLGKGGG